jgi:hypothetical protein
MLDQKFAKEWIADLRSHKHKQIKKSLRYKDGFCCLGRACEIGKLSSTSTSDGYYYYQFGRESRDGYLPDGFREQIGLSHEQQGELARMNDNGKTFDEIADKIESWLTQ